MFFQNGGVTLLANINLNIRLMKFFSKVLTVLFFCALLNSCSDMPDTDNTGTISTTSIASISQQLGAIKESLPSLKSTLKSTKSLFGLDLRSKASDNGSVNGVKDYIFMLEERIDILEEYVLYNDNDQWLETTYATIDMYKETVTILAVLQSEIDAMKGELSASQVKLHEEVKQNIADSFISIKGWVNEQLTGYYDIAAVDAIILQLQKQIEDESAEVRADVLSMREELEEQMSDLENTYKDVIREAIEKNNGTLTDELFKSIEKVNTDLQKSLSDINRRLDDIENRLSKLEGTVSELLKRIQSITYVPIYADNKARVIFPNEDTSGGTLQLDFIITDESVVTELAKVFKDVVKVRAMYIGSPTQIELIATNCAADSNQGLFSITVACDNMDMDFYNGSKDARVIMNISDGISNHNSGYIDVVPYHQQIPDNQIWYKTSDNSVISLQKGTGPNILSNVYDPIRKTCVVTFERDVTTILSTYFSENGMLTSVTLPNSVVSVMGYAFDKCSNLSEVRLGNSLESIGMCAFRGCSFRTLHIPQSLNSVGTAAILSDNQMDFTGAHISEDGKCLIIDNSLKACARGGIRGTYTLPSGIVDVQFVGAGHQTTEIIIPEGVKSIGNAALQDSGIERIVFPESLENIGNTAMSKNNYLTDVVFLSKNPPLLGTNVFHNCPSLATITIPSVRETVIAYETGDWPKDYKALLSWDMSIFSERIIEYTTNSKWNVTFEGAGIISQKFNNGKGYVFLDESVSEFTQFAAPNSYITDITIPPCIKSIADGAFGHWEALEHVSLPDHISSIGSSAFSYCTSLKSIVLPANLSMIGDYAFYACRELTEITIPENVQSIGSDAFSYCDNVQRLVFLAKNPGNIKNGAFVNCRPQVFEIPEGDDVCLSYITTGLDAHLKQMIFKEEYIDLLPESYKLLYKTNDGVQIDIKGDALYHAYEDSCGIYVSSLPIVEIPSLDNYKERITAITLPDSIETLPEQLFSNCTLLSSITLPKYIKVIPKSFLNRCSSLTELYIPEGVQSIENSAISYTGISQITLPSSVISLGYRALGYNPFTDVTVKSLAPPVADDNVLGKKRDFILRVPMSAIDAYKAAEGWSIYSSQMVGW